MKSVPDSLQFQSIARFRFNPILNQVTRFLAGQLIKGDYLILLLLPGELGMLQQRLPLQLADQFLLYQSFSLKW